MKRCVVTGANAGIGFAAARRLAILGHHVTLGCRDRGRGADAIARIASEHPAARLRLVELDMADASSVVRAARELSAEGPVDVLIHNAAHFDLRRKQPLLTSDGIEVTWATNVVGPALLTHLLLPLLVASPDPRVIAVTSKGLAVFPRLAVSLHDPELRGTPFSASRSYYHSKLAHLAWSLALAERLASSRVRVHAVRVGNVKLDLGRYPGLSWGLRAAYSLKSLFSMSPDAMAQTYVWLATSSEAGDCTGAYWDAPLKAAPISTWARSREQRDALWSLIETQTRNITSP